MGGMVSIIANSWMLMLPIATAMTTSTSSYLVPQPISDLVTIRAHSCMLMLPISTSIANSTPSYLMSQTMRLSKATCSDFVVIRHV